MLKCPSCGFENEDGSLFCEHCKSDLGAVTPGVPMGLPMGQVVEAPVPMAQVLEAPVPQGIPVAEVLPAQPAPEPGVANIPPEEVAPAPLPAMAPPLEIKSPGEGRRVDEVGAAPAAAPAAPAAAPLPAGAQPKLVVMRGLKIGAEFPIYPQDNYIGRSDDKPVDIDLEDQEPPDRVWCSRQHAVIHYDEAAGTLTVEDLNSSNGTYVNRQKVYPGQPRPLGVNDTVQIGTVHLKVKA